MTFAVLCVAAKFVFLKVATHVFKRTKILWLITLSDMDSFGKQVTRYFFFFLWVTKKYMHMTGRKNMYLRN